MPLNTNQLKDALKTTFLANLPSPNANQISEVESMSGAMANAIQAFVQSATITYSAGLIAPPGGGPVTGIFTNIIS